MIEAARFPVCVNRFRIILLELGKWTFRFVICSVSSKFFDLGDRNSIESKALAFRNCSPLLATPPGLYQGLDFTIIRFLQVGKSRRQINSWSQLLGLSVHLFFWAVAYFTALAITWYSLPNSSYCKQFKVWATMGGALCHSCQQASALPLDGCLLPLDSKENKQAWHPPSPLSLEACEGWMALY